MQRFIEHVEKMKKSPIDSMSPEMKAKMTPERLKVMNCCGMSYLIIVMIVMFWTSIFTSMPIVYAESPDTLFYRRIFAIYLLVVSVANLYFLSTKTSYLTKSDMSHVLPSISWKKCIDCDIETPPRSHHCPLCRKCILKRDHHCFFTGSCVGFQNQRYFIVFSTYSTLGSLYASYLMYTYIGLIFQGDNYRFYDYILPVATIKAFFGYQTFAFVGALLVVYLNMITFFGSLSQISIQIFIVAQGLTTHEYTSGISTYKSFNILRNYRAVLGPYWFIHFIAPCPWLKIEGDGLSFDAKLM